MFPKRWTQRKSSTHVSPTQAQPQPQPHAHHTLHAHDAHNAHHAFMYVRVYSCTYCGRKGHLAKFYYDKMNASTCHVWDKKKLTFRYQSQHLF